MKFKMLNVTTHGETNLCLTCRHGSRRRAATSNNDEIRCSALHHNPIMEPMAECSQYDDKRHPSLMAMREIAWHVSTDKKKGVAGFYSPRDFKKAVESGAVVDNESNVLLLPGGGSSWD